MAFGVKTLTMSTLRGLRQYLADRLWLRPTIASVLAAALAIAAAMIDIRSDTLFGLSISQDTLVNLLSMVATSMLTVATFSVAAIVTATTALSQSTTPRVTRLVLADATIKNVLASFISAFVYSIVAIFAVEALTYGSGGRVAVFLGLVAIIVWVLASFLRWVDHVTRIGRVGAATSRTASAALESVRPETVGTFGAAVLDPDEPLTGMAIRAGRIGYVQSVDTQALQTFAEDHDLTVRVTVRPGDLVDTVEPVAFVHETPADGEQAADVVLSAIFIADERTHDYDPRFGLVILAETATRALSPAVNDPGTAIVVLTGQLRVFGRWSEIMDKAETEGPEHPRVFMPRLDLHDMFEAAFTVFARDAANIVEVGLRFQKTLQALCRLGHPALIREAGEFSALALELAEGAPLATSQIERLKAEAAKVQAFGDAPAERRGARRPRRGRRAAVS